MVTPIMATTQKTGSDRSFEAYESLRDLTNFVGETFDHIENEGNVQGEWYGDLKSVCYEDAKDAFTLDSTSDYREAFGWVFSEYEEYKLITQESATLSEAGFADLFPRSDGSAREEYDAYRVPTVNDSPLPFLVTSEAELKEARSKLQDLCDREGWSFPGDENQSNDGGSTDSSNGGSSNYDGPFGEITGIGSSTGGDLVADPRAIWISEDRIMNNLSEAEAEKVEQLTDKADVDLLEAVSVEVEVSTDAMDETDMLAMIPEEDQDMVETLLEAGHPVEDILSKFL
jgi:hypothetical protein